MTGICHGDPCIVWHGGIGHRFLSADDGADQCYRCGTYVEAMSHDMQRLVPDCEGPTHDGSDHHWVSFGDHIRCERHGEKVVYE